MTRLVLALLLALVPLTRLAHAEAIAVFSDTGPEADAYGKAEGYPLTKPGTMTTQQTLVGTYSHYDELHTSRLIPASTKPSKFTRAAAELQLSYSFEGKSENLESYLARNPTTGLLILSDQTIEFEHYRYARTEHDRFTSQSMAKTIVGMMLGIAIADGSIHSVDDTVSQYVPELDGTEPGRTPLRALLTMTSGLRFHEVYDGKDDIMRLNRALMQKDNPGRAVIAKQFDARSMPAGTEFNYSGLDTELLSLVISRATKTSLSDYVAAKLWQPMGAEAPASWILDTRGNEVAYCCFNATLRDYARLGGLLADDGVWNGSQIIPKQWVHDATTPASPLLAPGAGGRRYGYGYQLWLLPGERHQFALRGIHGQTIMIDPASKTVLVHLAVRPNATNNVGEAELMALWNALVAHNAGL
jgi:CubicO group peptidase (beta-lactamase class C family)